VLVQHVLDLSSGVPVMALKKFLCPAGDSPGFHQLLKASHKIINVEYGELRDTSIHHDDGKRRGMYQMKKGEVCQ